MEVRPIGRDGPGRLVIVSNRLPITIDASSGALAVRPSAGGLASALRGLHEPARSLWIGWPGATEGLSEADERKLARQLARLGASAIRLSEVEIARFYDGFSNGVLWPTLHYLMGLVPLRAEGWEEYERVNRRYARAVIDAYRPGDTIWVHDYHLMLVPRLVRDEIPTARIGFFLHTPFPAAELFATLPNREALLRGLMGADLIGFHTEGYRGHFRTTVERVLGLRSAGDDILKPNRPVRLGVFPIGVDSVALASAASEPEVLARAAAIRGDRSCRLMVGIDRLDYTKGIPRRLLAFEELLDRRPQWREGVSLLQVAVPSRTGVTAYQRLAVEVQELVTRINTRFGTDSWTPVRYLHHAVADTELLALYRVADVMLVTPVRDGMNLIAKEFAATRCDGDGVLVLSEFAGAAAELTEALLLNPYDVDRAAEVYHRALTMTSGERRARMRALRASVAQHDVHRWAASFLHALDDVAPDAVIAAPLA